MLNYLLEFRDRCRKLDPVLPDEKARRVLSTTALWMQEKLGRDEVSKDDMHNYMQPILQMWLLFLACIFSSSAKRQKPQSRQFGIIPKHRDLKVLIKIAKQIAQE